MKRILLIIVAVLSLAPCSFSQKREILQTTRIQKETEKNYKVDADGCKQYNFDSKSDREKLFFGDFNAKLEFFASLSFRGEFGFRIVADSTGKSYLIEAKRSTNSEELSAELSKEFPLRETPGTVTLKNWEETSAHNKIMLAKQNEEYLKRYAIEVKSVNVSDSLAEKLYHSIWKALDAAPKESKTDGLIRDGYSVKFRCVDGDNLLTLKYYIPEGEFLQLSDICTLITKDIFANTFDESKYLGLLEK